MILSVGHLFWHGRLVGHPKPSSLNLVAVSLWCLNRPLGVAVHPACLLLLVWKDV